MTSVNRRTFLASAGAGYAALAAPTRSRAAGPNDRLRVAVLGVRGRGEAHISAFSKNKSTEVAVLCDPDRNEFDQRIKQVRDLSGKEPACVKDLRKVFDDKSIDVVSIATPNHWHALAAVWACQAGKHVYVEKPVSHNVSEGRKIVEAAERYKRIVQTGTQSRSSSGVAEAVEFIRSGKLGKIFLAKGLCYKPRASIGKMGETAIPEGVDYDLWLGPAPSRPFQPNRFHYNWHWFWDTGNGDIGNQGIHQMDVARWGLGKSELPPKILSSGGRFGYSDDGETPNTQIAAFRYEDCLLEFEVRGLYTHEEKGIKIGNIFYGTEGYLALDGGDWSTYFGSKGEPGPSGKGGGDHFGNFVDAVLANDPGRLNAPIIEGHLSSALCHLANISYRLGREVNFDPKAENFGSDQEANALLTREYRAPFVMPATV